MIKSQSVNSNHDEVDSLRNEYQEKINQMNKKYLEENKALSSKLKQTEDNTKSLLQLVKTESGAGLIQHKETISKVKGKCINLIRRQDRQCNQYSFPAERSKKAAQCSQGIT